MYQNFDPTLEYYSQILTLFSFTCATSLLPILVYLIITQSKQMSKYKYYLLNCIFWSYIFQLLIFAIRPGLKFLAIALNLLTVFKIFVKTQFSVPLFPSYCFLFFPIFSIPTQIIQYTVYTFVIISINMCMGIVYALFYRYSQAFPGWLDVLFEQSKIIYFIYALVQTILYIIIAPPFFIGLITDKDVIKKQFLKENPDMNAYSNTQMVCFVNNETSILFGLIISLTNLLFFIFGNALTLFLYIRIKNYKSGKMYSTTQRLQLMLFKAFSGQLNQYFQTKINRSVFNYLFTSKILFF